MAKKGSKSADTPLTYGSLKVQHAPTGRASCKKCKRTISQGFPRVGRVVKSGFHDGFDTLFYCWDCGKEFGSSVDDFVGWMSLDWSSVSSMLSKMKEKLIADKPTIEFYKSRSSWVSEAAQVLEALKADVLKKTMETNRMFFAPDANAAELAAVVADQLLFGKLPQCPLCKTFGLRQSGSDIVCHGYYSESTKCVYKFRLINLIHGRPDSFWDSAVPVGDSKTAGQLTRVGDLVLPDEVTSSNTYKSLKIPQEVQELRKKGGKRGGRQAVKRGADQIEAEPESKSNKVAKLRVAPIPGSPLLAVDSDCGVSNGQIYVDKAYNAYNVMLMKADAINNFNRFYGLQLVVHGNSDEARNKNPQYSVFRKWGRMGAIDDSLNDSRLERWGSDLNGAIEFFHKTFKEKSGQVFLEREFRQLPGCYSVVEISGQSEDPKNKKKTKKASMDLSESVNNAKSELASQVQSLIVMIFDLTVMEQQMSKSLGIDTSQLSLEALSTEQLKKGMTILEEVSHVISAVDKLKGVNSKKHGRLAPHLKNKTLHELAFMIQDASNRFYTIIPHSVKKGEALPMIDDLAKMKDKLDALEDLAGIVEMQRIMQFARDHSENASGPAKTLVDTHYEQLNCSVKCIADTRTTEYVEIARALHATHAPTHNHYSMQVVNVFQVSRKGEYERFSADPCQTNKKMLWHGSRITNWASILKNGLRIAPKEAPVTGYMFGKGIYFADASSKSANYCFPTHSQTDGLMVLCEVSCGKQYRRLSNEFDAPTSCQARGCDSTLGIGRSAPSDTIAPFFSQGIATPLYTGKLQPNDTLMNEVERNEACGQSRELLYNEYIVYRESQVCMRYVVHVKFTL